MSLRSEIYYKIYGPTGDENNPSLIDIFISRDGLIAVRLFLCQSQPN